MGDYIVQSGDNLSKIAAAHGTTVEALCKENGIKDANKIQIGQCLSLGQVSEEEANAQQANESLEAKLAEQDAKIAELENRGISDMVKEDVNEAVDWAKDKYEQGKKAVKDGMKSAGEWTMRKINEANEATTEFVNDVIEGTVEKYEKAKEAVNETVKKADDAFDEAVGDAQEFANKKLLEAQAREEKLAEHIKFDTPEEETVDTSNMTLEERAEYNEKRIKELEQRGISDIVKDGVNDYVKEKKQAHNDRVDKVVETRGKVRGWFASAINKGAEWLKGLIE